MIFFARMVMRESNKDDRDLKEACLYAGWKLVTSLATELEHLDSLTPDPEVLNRIAEVRKLQDFTAQNLKTLVEI